MMTEPEKQAERDKLFKMFADGKTTVEELFQYFKKFAEDHPNDLKKNSPFYGRKFKIPVTAQEEDIEMSSPTLDRMIEYLLYDRDNYFLLYRRLRWNKEKDDSSTYGQNIADIREDAKSFRQQYNNISSWTLTDAVKKILVRFKNLENTSEDKKFWEEVLKIMSNTVPTAPAGPSAYDKIKDAIKASAESKKCVVFTGAPGTGKTYCVEEYVKDITKQDGEDRKPHPNWEFVQFHSSYDYTDFVEGLRPVKNEKGDMVFRRMDGIFKAFCRRAAKKEKEEKEKKEEEKEKKEKFYFIIDEINRADLGRVFGELMYCFEKRGEKHRIAMQYANLDTYDEKGQIIEAKDDCFKNGFYIPENVVIIGTMNDIDRSVETFDFALRRRFDWVEIKADEVMDSSLRAMMEHLLEEEKKTDEAKVKSFVDALVCAVLPGITKMNKLIKNKSVLGEEYEIGHAYFKDYDAKTGFKLYDEKSGLDQKNHKKNLNAIWEHNIKPILREYMRGRQKADEFVIECGVALGVLEKKSETNAPNGSEGAADAQPGEQK